MRKLSLFILALVMALSLTACGSSHPEATQLGTSAFSIQLPDGYKSVEDDYDEDQIAYYYKDDESVDFDVFQWTKGDQYTLESEAVYFANEYGTTPESVVINGINGMKYTSEELYDGHTYTVVNYMFEDADSSVELSFRTIDTSEEYAVVDEIIHTLKQNG